VRHGGQDGYSDKSAAVNGFASERVPLQEYATILEAIELPEFQ
jgi:hypothetical protein